MYLGDASSRAPFLDTATSDEVPSGAVEPHQPVGGTAGPRDVSVCDTAPRYEHMSESELTEFVRAVRCRRSSSSNGRGHMPL